MAERNLYKPGYTQKLLNKAKGYSAISAISTILMGADIFVTNANINSQNSEIIQLQNNIDSIFGKGKYVIKKK